MICLKAADAAPLPEIAKKTLALDRRYISELQVTRPPLALNHRPGTWKFVT